MSRGTIGVALAIVDIAGSVVVSVVLLSAGSEYLDATATFLFVGSVLAFSSIGALLIRRVPKNPVGALLLAVATVQVAGPALATYALVGGAAVPPWPGVSVANAFGDFMYIAPYVIALVGIPLLFPDGRLPSPRFRWVAWITAAAMLAQLLPAIAALIPGIVDLGVLGAMAGVASLVAAIIGIGGAAAAIWVRFRRADAVQRLQLKWLLAVAAVAAIAFPIALVLEATWPAAAIGFWLIGYLAYVGLPVAIAIAVLRYRLYEIDVIINRALVYVSLTAIVAGIYAALVALSGRALAAAGQSSDMAIVLTTLVVVVIFTPIKNGVQAAVDRRFKVAPAPHEQHASASGDLTELLRKLGTLRDQGFLTTEEFEAKKGELLARL
jgi:hypothetical protein